MTGGLEGPPPEDRQRPSGRRNHQGIRIDPEVEAEPDSRRTVISTLVKHEPGVLSEVSGLFSRRQFNIESLTVGPTIDDSLARITLVIEESEPGIEQAKKQLRKLVSAIAVRELEPNAITRELMLIKVNATRPDQVAAVADMYGGKTVDSCSETATIQITGSRQKIDAAIETFGQFGILEISRTGTTALARGADYTASQSPVSELAPEYRSDGTPTKPQTTPADDD